MSTNPGVKPQDFAAQLSIETFPQYFRKNGIMVRRDSPTTGVMIKLPAPKASIPNSIDPLTQDTYPSRERFDAYLIDFELSDQDTYNQFFTTYCKNASYMHSRFQERQGGQLTINH